MHDETAGDEGRGSGGVLPEGAGPEGGGELTGDHTGHAAFAATSATRSAGRTAGTGSTVCQAAAPEQDPACLAAADRTPGGPGNQAGPGNQVPAGPAAADQDTLKHFAAEPDGVLPDSEVFIEIPADRLYVVLARSAAVHLGSVLHLGITDVTDLRLAVDEACALFLLHPAFPDGREVGLACRFAAYREELRVTVRAPVPAGFAPDTEAIGWIMLGALVDDLAWTRQDGYGTLTLTKRIAPSSTR